MPRRGGKRTKRSRLHCGPETTAIGQRLCVSWQTSSAIKWQGPWWSLDTGANAVDTAANTGVANATGCGKGVLRTAHHGRAQFVWCSGFRRPSAAVGVAAGYSSSPRAHGDCWARPGPSPRAYGA